MLDDAAVHARARAALAYDAAADAYDDNAFWARYGGRTVDRLALPRGGRALDVCSGSGASAIPLARRVGPGGRVIATDVAARLLDRARAKADRAGLKSLETRAGDALALDEPDASFDAVVCVFGIFFFPDMEAATARLWRWVKPGGVLAITTWGKDLFEPLATVFWEAAAEAKPGTSRAASPWERIDSAAGLTMLFRAAGVPSPKVVEEAGTHPVPDVAAAWAIVAGTGFRGTVEELDAAGQARLRARVEAGWQKLGRAAVTTDVVYATARKD